MPVPLRKLKRRSPPANSRSVTSSASAPATITGGSLPADKKVGDEVFAGTQNLTGVLEIKVSRAGEDTTLGRVRELIIAAEKTKLPIQKIVDQYMGFYTPLVLVIAALVWAFTRRLDNVISDRKSTRLNSSHLGISYA